MWTKTLVSNEIYAFVCNFNNSIESVARYHLEKYNFCIIVHDRKNCNEITQSSSSLSKKPNEKHFFFFPKQRNDLSEKRTWRTLEIIRTWKIESIFERWMWYIIISKIHQVPMNIIDAWANNHLSGDWLNFKMSLTLLVGRTKHCCKHEM